MIFEAIGSIHRRLVRRHPWQEPALAAIHRARADAFFEGLANISLPIGSITHAFSDHLKQLVGYVQLHRSGATVTLHRIWTVRPGQGHGRSMLNALCELADRHQVHLQLKVAPLGAKPYPLSADQLRGWYHRYGFHGTKWLVRQPIVRSQVVCS